MALPLKLEKLWDGVFIVAALGFVGWWLVAAANVFILQTLPVEALAPWSDYSSAMFGVVAVLALSRIRSWGDTHSVLGKVLLFIGLGSFFNLIGDIAWDFYQSVLGVEVPEDQLPALFYLAYYVFIALALWKLIKLVKSSGSWKPLHTVLLTAVPLAVFSFLVWQFALPEFQEEGLNLLLLLHTLYLLLDSLLIGLGLTVLVSWGGVVRRGIMFLAGSAIVVALADYLIATLEVQEIFYDGNVGEFLLITAAVMRGIGVYLMKPPETETT